MTFRMTVSDWKMRWPRPELPKSTGRMTPRCFVHQAALIIKCAVNLWDSIERSLYLSRRYNNKKLNKSIRTSSTGQIGPSKEQHFANLSKL